MTEFQIHQGFPSAARYDAARLYWDAFKAKLGRIMRPEDKALAFFASVLDPDYAISALDPDGTLLGVAGYKTAKGAMTGAGLHDLAAAYGWIGCLWRAPVLSLLDRPVEPGILLMDGICVDANARGRGVGTALLAAIKAEAGRRGLASVRLDVIDSNPRAKALYEREGFVALNEEDIGPMRHIFGFQRATEMRFQVAG